jgi:hypothetical protein
MGAQFGGRERPNPKNLIDFPLKKLEGAETGVENIRIFHRKSSSRQFGRIQCYDRVGQDSIVNSFLHF